MNRPVVPLKVLFVVPTLGIGGAEKHITTLLPKMDTTLFEPSLICIGEEGALFSVLGREGVDAVALGLPGKRNFVSAFRELTARMRRLRPDAVVVWGYSAEVLGRISAIAASVKTRIVWVHNCYDAAPRSLLRRAADRSLNRWTDSYFGVAEAQRVFMEQVLRYPAGRIRIIYNGVDPALYRFDNDRGILTEFGISSDDPVVAIVAGLRVEKDHPTFLRAAQLVLDTLPNTKFLIVGDGSLRGGLEALAERLGIVDSTRFLGWRSDVDRILRATDVFALCSYTTECFPFSVLEAMAAGRPVVSSDVGGVGEMIEPGISGYLVAPRSPNEFAARLVDVLSDREAASRMGLAARRRVETYFTLDQSVNAAEQLLEECIRRRATAHSNHVFGVFR